MKQMSTFFGLLCFGVLTSIRLGGVESSPLPPLNQPTTTTTEQPKPVEAVPATVPTAAAEQPPAVVETAKLAEPPAASEMPKPAETPSAPSTTGAAPTVEIPPAEKVPGELTLPPVEVKPAEPVTAGIPPVTETPALPTITEPVKPQEPAAKPEAKPISIPTEWKDVPTPAPAKGRIKTVGEHRGNWLEKAKIRKDAGKLFEKVRKISSGLLPVKEQFARRYAEYLSQKGNVDFGFKVGEVDERLALMTNEIKKMESTAVAVTAEQRALIKDIQDKHAELEKLRGDIQFLQKIQQALADGIALLDGQVTQARGFEDAAWRNYEDITETLSDEKARQLYRGMEVYLANIEAISKYMNGEFAQFFEKQITDTTAQVDKIKQGIDSLKAKGVELGKKVEDQAALEEAKKRALEAERLKKACPTSTSWLGMIQSFFVSVWNAIVNAFTWLCKLVGICR